MKLVIYIDNQFHNLTYPLNRNIEFPQFQLLYMSTFKVVYIHRYAIAKLDLFIGIYALISDSIFNYFFYNS